MRRTRFRIESPTASPIPARTPNPTTATVVAAFPTVALELSRDQFQEAIRQHPAVLTQLYQLATSRRDELRTVVAQQALDVEEIVLV